MCVKLGKLCIVKHNCVTLGVFIDYIMDNWTIKARDARRITAAEMKYMRRTAGYTWAVYKTNKHIAKELEITPVLDKLLEYKRNWIQRVNRMPRDRLPRIMKHYSPIGRRNRGRPLKKLLDTWDRNGSTSGLTPWQTYDDDMMMTITITLRLRSLFLERREKRILILHPHNYCSNTIDRLKFYTFI